VNALTHDEALENTAGDTKQQRVIEKLKFSRMFTRHTTSAGWLGYSDEKIRRLIREALAKVGRTSK